MYKTYSKINNIVTSSNRYSTKVKQVGKLQIGNSSVKIGNVTASKIIDSYNNRYKNFAQKYNKGNFN